LHPCKLAAIEKGRWLANELVLIVAIASHHPGT
jgi:hypothetical protein